MWAHAYSLGTQYISYKQMASLLGGGYHISGKRIANIYLQIIYLQPIPDSYTMYNSPLPLDLLPNTAFPLPPSSLPASPTIATSSKLRSTMRTNYPEEIDLGTFIVERWKQAGVGHVFGVPGDFNLGVSLNARPGFLEWRFQDSPLHLLMFVSRPIMIIVLGLHRGRPPDRMGRHG